MNQRIEQLIPPDLRQLASQWGKIGGSVKSPRKTEACRMNARLPRRREITRARALALVSSASTLPAGRIFYFIFKRGAKFFKKADVIEFVVPSRIALAKNGGIVGRDEIVGVFNIETGSTHYELRRIKGRHATHKPSIHENKKI